ncbi:MAG: SAM-dependent methyltransferase, partial [Anaerolineales bacterium]
MEKGIIVIGLGPGDPHLLTREAWDVLSDAVELHLRTGFHPIVPALPAHLEVNTFDSLYDELDSFEAVYAAIVDRLIDLAANSNPVVYGVPGDPTVGEATVVELRHRTKELGVELCNPATLLLYHIAKAQQVWVGKSDPDNT